MADQTWTKTTSGAVFDTLGINVGAANGAGVVTLTATTVQVTNGNTLRIEEGVTVVMVSPSGRFLVTRNATGHGTFTIVGTEVEPVRFTSPKASPAAGDWNGVELLNTNAASNPTMTAQWLIIEYATTGVFTVSGSQQCTVTLTHCTFRRIASSHLQTAVIPAGVWNATRCVFDKCEADQPAANSNNLFICSGGGTGPTMTIDHASILCRVAIASGDQEVFQAGPRGTLSIRNSIIQGLNTSAIRALNKLIVLAPGGVASHDWNWYNTPDQNVSDQWVDGPHDRSQNPGYFDADCSGGNSDLRPDFDTGVSTADEFGALLGALEPWNTPAPPVPPGEVPCSTRYAGFQDATCVPFVCDYDFFTGEYPEDWRRELYDRKNVSPHELIVCLEVPGRAIPLDFEFAPGVPIPIETTEESQTVDIGCWVQSMRPIRAERDVTFREYQGSDIDLVFMDWFGRLDPKVPGSLFNNIRWRGLRVDIGSWIQGTDSVLKHGRYFLADITRRNENTVLRVRDWFLEMLDTPLRGNICNFEGSLSFESDNPNVSFGLSTVIIDRSVATIESVRLVMQDEGRTDSRRFKYVGSVTGDQGEGSFDSNFVTADGAVTILAQKAWAGASSSSGFFAPGDEVRFKIVNLAFGNPVVVCFDHLTRSGPLVIGTDIILSEFLEAVEFLPSTAEIRLRHESTVTVLEACRLAASHGFLTLSTNAAGRVVLGGFKPTLALDLSAIEDVAICSSNDLIELETENLPIYNIIRTAYNPLDPSGAHSGLVTGTPTRWLNYPTEDLGADFNRSLIFWNQAFPFDIDLPGFRAGQEAALFAILQSYWIFFEGTPTPREKLKMTTKLHNLNRDLEDVVRVESLRPARQVWAQIVGFGKAPLVPEIELTGVDISDIVQPDFACGYAFCDSGHYCDDCWVCY